MIYAGVDVSRKEGKKELSVICIEVVVKGTRGNEGAERSGVHDEEQRTKDRRCPLGGHRRGMCAWKTGRFHI